MQSPLVKNADYIQDKGRYGPLKVKSSPAGYYIGTDYHTEDGYTEPGSRDSGYFGTRAEAEAELKLMETLESEEPVDISTPAKLRAFMAAATSLDDWGHRCTIVKSQTGEYPKHWHQVVNQSGLLESLNLPCPMPCWCPKCTGTE